MIGWIFSLLTAFIPLLIPLYNYFAVEDISDVMSKD